MLKQTGEPLGFTQGEGATAGQETARAERGVVGGAGWGEGGKGWPGGERIQGTWPSFHKQRGH